MGLAVTLTLVSLSFVFAAVKLDPFSSYTIKQNPHAIVGSICIICAVIQPFMSLFRYYIRLANTDFQHFLPISYRAKRDEC